ncbi:hypothetical protein TMatcc_006772 [Talaromyces marneffei ATCC 18224]|uniref:NAD-dependent epimerase/dehydratase domain-containing protein n=2 Tax=Talaromyces marneffei TaxID=37727 RepID=B6QCY0_TALMQ|nr:uncharacterized protein EYB26_003796 [Talaromyces marneffei]EEA23691.1 conserved hypothetical protein [Talaromyces marneffei ATCC 18224]KAE8553772.1 hypothetical protein EYB25_005154 [Talaromyces marneffei]QGA16129.1 hypothetical protein EYB26_003796 [Talaromyces marneffei]
MPRVLIIGATGYVGRRIATLLVQSGQHSVYGIARTQRKASLLQTEEIMPIICPDPVDNPGPYLVTIRSSSIDIVIDVSEAGQGSHTFLRDVKRLGEERIESYRAKGIVNAPKLGYIYCSGTWVHGSSDRPVTDLNLVGPESQTPPEELSAWRVALEKEILSSSDILDVMIIRPALIYGRESTIWTPYFMPVLEATRNKTAGFIGISLVEDSRPGLIHVDDVATAFQKAVEKLPLIAGARIYPVFDLVTSQESMRDIFDAVALHWGFNGTIQLIGHGGDLFSKAMSATFNGSSARAELLLEWRPRRLGGFVKDMGIYAMALSANL